MSCAAVAAETEVKLRAFVPAGCPAHAAPESEALHVKVYDTQYSPGACARMGAEVLPPPVEPA